MKILIALLIAIPTLIAILLFTVAGFAYSSPVMLAATSNPVIAILCIISGVIAALPLVATVIVGLGGILASGKSRNIKEKQRKIENNGYTR